MKPEQVIGAVGMSSMAIRPGDTSVAQGVNDYCMHAAVSTGVSNLFTA